jgi:hypothetical protein
MHILPETLRSALTVPEVRFACGTHYSNKLHYSIKILNHGAKF